MGIYNFADILNEAIDSIIAQTYTNQEFILCDDGSSDDTYDVAKKYVEQYPSKFVLIKNEANLGLNKTLNNCLELATGDYVARMDGDDKMKLDPKLIEKFDIRKMAEKLELMYEEQIF